ncbi:hypothetical protein ACFOOK_04110 [Micromonospora krabiensis]|uniref:DUF4345 domain-containing protein n=1 Tax=Micromonospora krabiensis TaxID=307121 RepID=A0A1C3NE12_9ACTN|nr:hypothetical protein [Micromonospora krabiensis]SBV30825.1 hypothetical protein GA0070620_6427 [Micromonospora krabiensis]
MRAGNGRATFWTLTTLGALGGALGGLGVVSPERQLRLSGFENPTRRGPGDQTSAVLGSSSFAAIGEGGAYLVGAAKGWPGFPAYVMARRLLMAGGLAGLAATGRAPRAFLNAAAWEALGALAIGAASWLDRRPAERPA